MDFKSKFEIGQDVCLFNSVSMQIEHDEIYAILVAPQPVDGREYDSQMEISKAIAEGLAEVKVQYQLQYHQGLLDEKVLFATDEECRAFFRTYFSE